MPVKLPVFRAFQARSESGKRDRDDEMHCKRAVVGFIYSTNVRALCEAECFKARRETSMFIAEKLLKKYRKADEKTRIDLYLEHRRLRTTFDEIDGHRPSKGKKAKRHVTCL